MDDALDDLPPNAVLPLDGRDPEALERAARAAGQRWLRADCARATDKAGVMAALALGFGLPPHFGRNLDALYDCLTELEPESDAPGAGIVLLVEHLPGAPGFDAGQREALLEVLRDAAEDFADRGLAFRAYWSDARR
ncbi:MAG TPA: barstar family protein [Burkholderiaceae bacterium]|nr:barstar family protein [Burkholderiaceae bacterium]